jgi:hypothetical protein
MAAAAFSRLKLKPDSDGWVNEEGLSVAQYVAIQNRSDRERDGGGR